MSPLNGPLFKGGSRPLPSMANYRPVILTSTPCKILERIVFRHIILFALVDLHNLSDIPQHCFRRRRGYETQLVLLIEDLLVYWLSWSDRYTIVLDFCKAFDKVPNQRPLLKLEQIGIRGNVLSWIECFLTGRSQKAVLEGISSKD